MCGSWSFIVHPAAWVMAEGSIVKTCIPKSCREGSSFESVEIDCDMHSDGQL